MKSSPPLLFLFPLLSLTACERGCLSRWMEDHALEHGSAGPKHPGLAQLRSVDCPDGLARCTSGVVEVSRMSSHPDPCSGPRETCECPWDRLRPCPQGCVAEDVELVLPRDRAVAQLCAPEPTGVGLAAFAEPVTHVPFDGGMDCADARFYCAGSSVVACLPGQPAELVARCIKGCSAEGLTLDDEALTEQGAQALLCRR